MGIICPLVGIGLTDLPKFGRGPPWPPGSYGPALHVGARDPRKLFFTIWVDMSNKHCGAEKKGFYSTLGPGPSFCTMGKWLWFCWKIYFNFGKSPINLKWLLQANVSSKKTNEQIWFYYLLTLSLWSGKERVLLHTGAGAIVLHFGQMIMILLKTLHHLLD